MKKLLLGAIVLLSGAFTSFATTPDDVSARQSVGLVLSGGGAKGIAHIGVIQALEENDIPIDYITGTSMGNIIGALYAMGYSPDEMLSLILSKGFSYWSTGKTDPDLSFYFAKPEPSPSMFSMGIGGKPDSPADSVPASLISPIPMSYAFMELFSASTAQCGGDFDKLYVPFRCVASNITKKEKHVFRSGQLGDAVRASMSFPIVFQPINIDGDLYYDGGIYDNFPVDVMREEFAPSIMIGVDVSTEDIGPQTTLMDQIENLVIQGGSYDLPAEEGIKLRLDLNRFGLLDFPAAKAIYKVGYDYAMNMMDSIKSRVHSRTPAISRRLSREVFRSATPALEFGNVAVYGSSPKQNEYIKYMFEGNHHRRGDTISADRARDAFYRAVSSGCLKDLYPQANINDSTGLFDLTLKASLKGKFGASVGGYLSSSTSSYIYLAADYSTLSFKRANARLAAWIGQSEMAGVFNVRTYLRSRVPSAIAVQAVASRERYSDRNRMFYDLNNPTFIIGHQYFGRAMWSIAAGRSGKVDIGAGYGTKRSSFYRDNHLDAYEFGRLYSRYTGAEVFARYTATTLDAPDYPTSGYGYEVAAMGIFATNNTLTGGGDVIHTSPRWAQLEIRTRNYPQLSSKFSLGVETDIMLSTRKLLPTYSASISMAPGFNPKPSSNNAFYTDFHANSFIGAGIVPVYKINQSLGVRLSGYGFVPIRPIEHAGGDIARYGKAFSKVDWLAEASIHYRLPFGANVSAYVNYASVPGDKWSVGLSFGVFMLPPSLFR